MSAQPSDSDAGWSEQNSRQFLHFGRFFVPEQEQQIATIVRLLPAGSIPGRVLELGCGEGRLAEAILTALPGTTVLGLDGSAEMRRAAGQRLERFQSRFQTEPFQLADLGWRQRHRGLKAIVSSLVVHHLRGPQKRQLFADLYHMLAPGGVLIVADVIAPAHPMAELLAADAWDAAVRRQADMAGASDVFEVFERERWNMYRYFDPDDIDHPSTIVEQLSWLVEAGFDGVDLYWMLAGHAIFGGFRPEPDETG